MKSQMKNHLITGHDDPNSNEIWQILTAAKELIKTKSYREEGFEKLQAIEADRLTPQQQIFYYYIKGKYYLLSYKNNTNDVESLSWANDYYSDMVSVAFENNIRIKNPKRHFVRAYTKYLLAQTLSNQEKKEKLLGKVQQIITTALRFNPDNSSFIWLQSLL